MDPQTWNELTTTLTDKLMGWLESAVAMVPNMVVAAAVVLVGYVLARYVRRFGRRGLRRLFDNVQLADLAAQVLYLGILIGAVFVALGVLQLEKTVTSLLAGVGIVGIALGFAFQDIAANFMSGVMMAARRPLRIGDLIQTEDHTGTVQHIDLRAVTLQTFTGESVIVPNKDVYGNALVNYTQTPKRRVDVSCGVAYSDDLGQAKQVVVDALRDLPNKCPDRDIAVYYKGFGGSSIDFTVQVWLNMATQPNFLQAQSEIIERIKTAFDAEGITIPFPIRTMDFGVAGGVPLKDMLSPLAADRTNDDDTREIAEAK